MTFPRIDHSNGRFILSTWISLLASTVHAAKKLFSNKKLQNCKQEILFEQSRLKKKRRVGLLCGIVMRIAKLVSLIGKLALMNVSKTYFLLPTSLGFRKKRFIPSGFPVRNFPPLNHIGWSVEPFALGNPLMVDTEDSINVHFFRNHRYIYSSSSYPDVFFILLQAVSSQGGFYKGNCTGRISLGHYPSRSVARTFGFAALTILRKWLPLCAWVSAKRIWHILTSARFCVPEYSHSEMMPFRMDVDFFFFSWITNQFLITWASVH